MKKKELKLAERAATDLLQGNKDSLFPLYRYEEKKMSNAPYVTAEIKVKARFRAHLIV